MRIITGKYKGRHFNVPTTFKARPTTDFAKENIFNVLSGYIDLNCSTALDLFSGTGAISLELISRGCSKVISIEKDKFHHSFICQCLEKLQDNNCRALRRDVFRYIKTCDEKFDFIFADPPYALENISTLPSLIQKYGLLKQNGIFVLEHGENYNFSKEIGFLEHRTYGSVNFSIFRW